MKGARFGQVELIVKALECTATNLDAVGGDGRTALITAAAAGHLDVVRALCAAGADLEVVDFSGLNAGAAAEAAGHASVAQVDCPCSK